MKVCESNLNDFQLLERSFKNERYFTVLYKRYNEWLYTVFFRRTGDRESACSMCNDIWLKVWNARRAILSGEGENASIKGYLYIKAASSMVDYVRARKKMKVELLLDDEKELSGVEQFLSESAACAAGNEVDEKSVRDYFRRLLARIEKDEDNRSLFWKIRVEGYSIQEMAAAGCISEGTVRSRLSRIAGKLRSFRPHMDLFLLSLCLMLF